MKKGINVLFLILSIFSIVYMGMQLHGLGALPLKYEIAVIGIMAAIVLLFYVLSIRFKNKFVVGMNRALLVVLCGVLIFGGFFIQETFSAVKKMMTPTAKVNEMSLVVMADSDMTSLDDISTMAFVSDGSDYYTMAMDVIKQEKPDMRFLILDDVNSVMEDLYEYEVDAILVREAQRGTFEEIKVSFDWDTKVVWNYLITEEITDITKEVNVVNTPFTVYLSGIDTYGDISRTSRTDVNMLVTINPNTKQVLLTSIPRDCWVELDNMKAYDKLTHSGVEGVENSVATIENFLGIDINYYGRVNFTSVIKIVDALGGVTVDNPRDFICYYSPWTNYKKGKVFLDGEHALEFARERHAFDSMFEDSERGDQIRVENQQLVVKAIVDKLLSPALLTKFQDLLSALEGTFETNVTTDELMALVRMQLDDNASWEIISQKIAGEYKYQYGGAYMPTYELIYYIPNEDSVKECVNNMEVLLSNKKLVD